MDQSSLLIIGANGQLGTALKAQYPEARAVDSNALDITSHQAVEAFDWSGVKVIINAAAYTNVDGAETPEGRLAAWQANAGGVAHLIYPAWRNEITLVHISTDYVFDGSRSPHTEDESLSPLSVYGASKAAGDLLASSVDSHYIMRTSWVIGEGKNFVRTMLELGQKGVNPSVVSDQIGRLTFTSTLAQAIDHLLTTNAPFGTYNVSNDGDTVSWADVARTVFHEAALPSAVIDTTTAEYYAGKEGIAARPLQSALDLGKIKASGFTPRDWHDDLHDYVQKELTA